MITLFHASQLSINLTKTNSPEEEKSFRKFLFVKHISNDCTVYTYSCHWNIYISSGILTRIALAVLVKILVEMCIFRRIFQKLD